MRSKIPIFPCMQWHTSAFIIKRVRDKCKNQVALEMQNPYTKPSIRFNMAKYNKICTSINKQMVQQAHLMPGGHRQA